MSEYSKLKIPQIVRTHGDPVNHRLIAGLVVLVDNLTATLCCRPHARGERLVPRELVDVLGQKVHVRNHFVHKRTGTGGHLVSRKCKWLGNDMLAQARK